MIGGGPWPRATRKASQAWAGFGKGRTERPWPGTVAGGRTPEPADRRVIGPPDRETPGDHDCFARCSGHHRAAANGSAGRTAPVVQAPLPRTDPQE
ncbi:hypothetical protein Sme01_36060 [Sphaerisporangium melleum]|uniref:Uncharacterized protein n=1 Tax=Sphaerisporangium melleum TaxID=321316 RepID=A0A917R9W2_9ACTN|nr:hypothetical protein GCM10007964_44710 [Sphaerisporangium melleum]GII71130.1 hypothetical protein Sme01_36060 [Sphaerisporangium melleum]